MEEITVETEEKTLPRDVELTTSRSKQITRTFMLLAVIAVLVLYGGIPALIMLSAFVVSVLIHEAGHFFVAKKAGMKATEFFIGFGPKIFSFTRGETTYGVKALPLGAYVKIVGMTESEEISEEDKGRTYISKPFRWRFATVIAGPAANILLALTIFTFISVFVGQPDEKNWSIAAVIPDTPAATTTLAPEEKIVSINGEEFDSYEGLVGQIAANGGQRVTLGVVDTEGQKRTEEVTLAWRVTPELEEIFPALNAGDIPLAINGQTMESYAQFTQAVENLQGTQTAELVFERRGGIYATDLTKPTSSVSELAPAGLLGISPFYPVSPKGPVVGLKEGTQVTFGAMRQAFEGLAAFFSPSGLSSFAGTVSSNVVTREETPSEALLPGNEIVVGDPGGSETTTTIRVLVAPPENQAVDEGRIISIVGIFRLGTQAAEAGLAVFLLIWGIINIFLALINLIPLLPFDGGHAAVAVWEKIKGTLTRNPNYRVDIIKLVPVSYIVIGFFLLLGLGALWLDIIDPIQNPF